MSIPHFVRTLAVSLALAGLSFAAPTAFAEPLAKFVVALKPDKNPEILRAEKARLETFLSAQLGRPVEAIIPLSSTVIIEGFANGTIDLGYLSATDFVNARARSLVTMLLVGQFADGRNAYDSYWVVKKDSPHTSIANLRGRPIAFASRTSTSGFVVPLFDLKQRGLLGPDASPESFFGAGNVYYGVGYVSAIERVLAGEADAAAVSYYVLDEDKHLSVEKRAQLRRLQSQGPVPSHVLGVRSSLTAPDVEALRAALLKLNESANTALRDMLFTTRLVPADADGHVAALAEALALARQALKQ